MEERDGERILPTQVRALNSCNLRMHKFLIIKEAILRFMRRVKNSVKRRQTEILAGFLR
jgi:hypothetical protein